MPTPSHSGGILSPTRICRRGFGLAYRLRRIIARRFTAVGRADIPIILSMMIFRRLAMTSMPYDAGDPTTVEQAAPWLKGRSFASWREEFDSPGYFFFERGLAPDRVAGLRAALAPFLARGLTGPHHFEGLKTNRVYALLAKSPHFAELAIHPLALAFAEAELGQSCLLSALLAINLHPGETVQPWHFDDGGAKVPRPRPALGVSAFWAIDDTTDVNGSTEVIPGSHLWDQPLMEGATKPADFTNKTMPNVDRDPGYRPDAVKMIMPSGSL